MMEYILFVLGIFLLIKGAGYLVEGASSMAKKLGVSTLIIGLTVVAFGTSMPELVVNVIAALKGAEQVAFGNIIGSNISNIFLVLGVTALICNIKVQQSTIWREIPFALLAALVLFIMANKFIIAGMNIFVLGKVDGLILLLLFGMFLYYAFGLTKQKKTKVKDKKTKIPERSNLLIFLLIAGGLVALYFGGRWTVEGAVFIAQQFGLSQFLISATIVAIGTSLPELVTSVTAALRKDIDLAVGNVVGSNIFNIFWILGLTALVSPISIPSFINTDLLILIFATLLLFIFMFVGKKHELEKSQGILFLLLYAMYIIFLVLRG